MKTILIIDVIGTPNAIIQKFGLQVFEATKPLLEAGVPVSLSFEGIANLTSGFCNASIGNIYQAFPKSADDLLKIAGIDDHPVWQEKVNDSIALATNPEKSKELDAAISELFA